MRRVSKGGGGDGDDERGEVGLVVGGILKTSLSRGSGMGVSLLA